MRNDKNSALLRRRAKRYLIPNQTEAVQNEQLATRPQQQFKLVTPYGTLGLAFHFIGMEATVI
ncbi:hypothetical protein, partial [Mesorhizobium sp. M0618]|uniref:hypothetical protein n=1 Tax=unclassified Mesorhizobium TaxID=325217 RepID=UPI003339D6C5